MYVTSFSTGKLSIEFIMNLTCVRTLLQALVLTGTTYISSHVQKFIAAHTLYM